MFKLFPLLAQRPRTLAAACGVLVALAPLPTHAQPCAQSPPGMVAWWPFDGSPNDIVGKNNPSLISGVGYEQGQVLQGVTFSQAPAGGIHIPDGTLTPKKFTVDAWVKVTGPSPGPDPNNDAHGSYIVAKPWNAYWPTIALTWSAYTYRFRFDFGYPNSKSFIDSASGGPGTAGPINYGPDGQFHHVAGTYDGATYRFYVDGDLKGSINDATPVDYSGQSFWTIGTNLVPAAGQYYHTFNGVIDEVEIFNRALKQTEIQGIFKAGKAGKCKPKKGMTWIQGKSDATTGTITVGCSGCDAAHGDTVCTELRPLLCIYKPKPPFQLPKGLGNDQYNRWSGGVVATTEPVAGNSFADIAAANSRCEDKFGKGWRVAEFHDGEIWNFQAYGGTVNPPNVPATRFWVNINDQKDGNCWTIPSAGGPSTIKQ
ncbi:MAG: LamG domain-containing protein [Chthoniobacterales bacterium]